MGRFNALKTTIDANIRENGNQEITGEILNRVLNEMVSVTEEEVADAAASGGGGGADLTEVNKKIAELTEETERLEADKQDALVSGSNIKTINGQNILGRGNIEIESGSGGITEEKEVYIGSDTPPKGTKLWIDPQGTPSSPSQPSGGGTNYVTFYGTWRGDDAKAQEKQAHNAESFRKVVEIVEQGGFPVVMVKDATELGAAEDMGIVGGYGGYPATYVFLVMPKSPLAEAVGNSGLFIQSGAFAEGATVVVNQDGSVTFA